MKENTIKVSPFDYGYTQDQVEIIPAQTILDIMAYAAKVKATQPVMAVPYEYPKSIDNKFAEDGTMIESNTEWEVYNNVAPYLKNKNKPIEVATELSILSDQLLYALSTVHEKNINSGKAQKVVTIEEEDKINNILK